MNETLITVPVITTYTLQLVKYVLRKYVFKNPNFDFAPIFYQTTLPFLTFLYSILFGYIGWGEPVAIDPSYILRWAAYVVLTLVVYQVAVKPSEEYNRIF